MKDLTVTAPPHAISRLSVRHIMLCVLLALLPAAANGVFLFGMDALFLLLACVGSAMLADLLIRLILRRSMAVFDFSSAVTGLLLGLTLPEKFPFWQGAIASAAAVIVIRECFGGLGRNLLNPANAARTALMLIFPVAMQHGAASGQSWLHLLLSDSAGFIGETSAAGILLGGAFLVISGIITPLTPHCRCRIPCVLHMADWRRPALCRALGAIPAHRGLYGLRPDNLAADQARQAAVRRRLRRNHLCSAVFPAMGGRRSLCAADYESADAAA